MQRKFAGRSAMVVLGCALIFGALRQVPVARAQEVEGDQSIVVEPGSGQLPLPEPPAESDFWSSITGGLTGVLPEAFRGHLLTQFSVGQTYETGLTTGSRTNFEGTATEAGASFLYHIPKKLSDYTLEYAANARHYERASGLDVLSHEAGIGQSVRWTERTTTNLGYRFTFTPDFSNPLPQESIANQLAVTNPVVSEPLVVVPSTTGLVTYRSGRMNHSASAGLSYQLTRAWRMRLDARGNRLRYQDSNLPGNEDASASVRLDRSLSRRTALGVEYVGQWFHQPHNLVNTLTHSADLTLTIILTRYVTLELTGGRLWTISRGADVVNLPPILADVVGTPTLIRSGSRSFNAWVGTANLRTHWAWKRLAFGIDFSRGITSNNLLGRPANGQTYTVNFAIPLWRLAMLSTSVTHQESKFFDLENGRTIGQGVLGAAFSHQLFGGLDLSAFVNLSKFTEGVENRGIFDHLQTGLRFVYHMPRVR